MAVLSSSSNDSEQPRDLSKGDKVKLLVLLVLLTGHATTLIVGASAVQYTTDSDDIYYGISAVHALLIPIVVLCLMVLRKAFCSGRCVNEKRMGKWFFHPIFVYLPVVITATWIIVHKKYVIQTDGTLPLCDDRTIASSLYQGEQVNLESTLFVMVQIISVVVLVARFLLPRGRLSIDDLSELLISGLAMAFDIADLQSNIHEDELKGEYIVAYFILVSTTLSLLQLIQLSRAFAYRFKESPRWQMFWTLYGIVFQEIPFFGIRMYILSLGDTVDVNELIWPAKNVLNGLLGAYIIYCTYRKLRDGSYDSEDTENETVVTRRSPRSDIFNTFCPIVVLLAQLALLVWRVAVVRGIKHGALALLLIPFVGVCLVRFVQLVKNSRSTASTSALQEHNSGVQSQKPAIWFKPLLMYVILAFVFMVLIVEGMSAKDSGFSRPTTEEMTCEDIYGTKKNETKDKFEVVDKISYVMIQASIPLVVMARAWMPRGKLSLSRYSSLLALHLTIAFDIAEFGHLMVDLLSRKETWEDDGAIAVRRAVLTLVGVGMILLAVMEGGLESESKETNKKYIRKIVWTALLVLLLDGPYFILRVYVLVEFKLDVRDLQLIFILKNTLVVAFSIYRIITLIQLWRADRNKSGDWQPVEDSGDQSLRLESFAETAEADREKAYGNDGQL